jgi:hypothetical protein
MHFLSDTLANPLCEVIGIDKSPCGSHTEVQRFENLNLVVVFGVNDLMITAP